MPEVHDHGIGRERANNIGLLRLLFAALVVVSHAPELVDGNRSREILTRIFGTLSFGEVAVDGFFLLSGYLIAGSVQASTGWRGYALRRALRIYPGFLVAFLVCVLVVAPLAGGDLSAMSVPGAVARAALLLVPAVPGAFAGLPHPSLDGAMWTIPFEVGCYALMAALGATGVLRRRGRFILVLAILAALYALRWRYLPIGAAGTRLGSVSEGIRLAFVFCCGGAFRVLGEHIVYTGRRAALAAAGLIPLLFVPGLAEPAFAVLGGFVAFWFALRVPPSALGLVANRTDVSYGLYLYAWPIQNLVVAAWPGFSPWFGAAVTMTAAGLCGLASWYAVERPMLRTAPRVEAWLSGRRPVRDPVATSPSA